MRFDMARPATTCLDSTSDIPHLSCTTRFTFFHGFSSGEAISIAVTASPAYTAVGMPEIPLNIANVNYCIAAQGHLAGDVDNFKARAFVSAHNLYLSGILLFQSTLSGLFFLLPILLFEAL